MSTHSLGPWRYENNEVVTPDGKRLLLTGVSLTTGYTPEPLRSEVRANARLIAAAPDLLAACHAALPYVEQMPWPAPERVVDAVRAAIAKATGQGGAA